VTTVCDNLEEDYGFFTLSDTFNRKMCGVDLCVCKIMVDELQPKSITTMHILLNGVIYQNGKYIKEGSIITSFENIQMIQDEITVLSLDKFDYEDDKKIVHTMEQLNVIVDELKTQDKKIVLSSGCFDILHVGHIKNLIEAKKMGDILMVCLSNDAQIKKLKGNDRPINNYQDRIDLFKTIKYVDYVILYDEKNIVAEETLGLIMRLVDPYIWVKGTDYKIEDIFKKHPYLKKIKLIDNIENKSTTKIIENIKK
jgi:rfaE bifunctional protein nucleotidyltransferase chain/domain